LAACDYLLKPFSIQRFIIAIDRVVEKLDHDWSTKPEVPPTIPSNHLLLRTEGRIVTGPKEKLDNNQNKQ
jgi:DNA-binding response OmpR family regulator